MNLGCPSNEGNGCYMNAPLLAIFGWKSPFFTSVLLTTPKLRQSPAQRDLRSALKTYVKSLYEGKKPSIGPIREAVRLHPSLAVHLPSGSSGVSGHSPSSASEFASMIFSVLAPHVKPPLILREDSVTWSGEHARVFRDRYFRWSGSHTHTSLKASSLSFLSLKGDMFRDLMGHPCTLRTGPVQESFVATLPFPPLTPKDKPSTLPTITHFSTLSAPSRGGIDFHLFRKPYMLKGRTLWSYIEDDIIINDPSTLRSIVKSLVPSFSTGSFTQKDVILIRRKVANGDLRMGALLVWILSCLGVVLYKEGKWVKDSYRFASGNDLLPPILEAYYLIGWVSRGDTLASFLLQNLHDDAILKKIKDLKENSFCLDEGGLGLVYTFDSSKEAPAWVHSDRLLLQYIWGSFILNVAPSPQGFWPCNPVKVKRPDDLVLTLSSGDRGPTDLLLMGAVTYKNGHYLTLLRLGSSWYRYDDLFPKKGYRSVSMNDLLSSLVKHGVLFVYGFRGDEQKQRAPQPRSRTPSAHSISEPKDNVNEKRQKVLACIKNLAKKKQWDELDVALTSTLPILFPLPHGILHSISYQELEGLSHSPSFQRDIEDSLKTVLSLWGLSTDYRVVSNERFHRYFLKGGYRCKTHLHLARILKSLGLFGLKKEKRDLGFIVRDRLIHKRLIVDKPTLLKLREALK